MTETKFRLQVRDPQGLSEEGVSERFIDASGEVLDRIAQTITGFADEVLTKVKTAKPSTIKLEFGVNAGGKAGIPFVTEGTVDAHVTIGVEWNLEGASKST